MEGKDTLFGGEYLCPVCRDRAMVLMLGELQVGTGGRCPRLLEVGGVSVATTVVQVVLDLFFSEIMTIKQQYK